MSVVGVVAVSHSRALAEAAVQLALDMVHGTRPRVVIAAGMGEGFGTDPVAVQHAIEDADDGAGVVVCTDLGSAVMSAEMALELMESEHDVKILPAPFVEGLVAAVVQAAAGSDLTTVAIEASRALEPKQALDTTTPCNHTGEWLHADVTLRNPAGLHARPAARIVAEVAKFDAAVRVAGPAGHFANASSPIALASLRASCGQQLSIQTCGSEAESALQALVRLAEDGFGEMGVLEPDVEDSGTWTLQHATPQGVSPGRVVGPAYYLVPPMTGAPEVTHIAPSQLAAEAEVLTEAIRIVAQDYEERAQGCPNPEVASILRATAILTEDQMLRETALAIMQETTVNAANAFWQSCATASEILEAAGGRIAERAADVHDIRNRVVSHLLGLPLPGIPDPGVPFVLLADDVSPSDTATLNPERCLAIVTRGGGPTSHTSILARSMGIPAVVGFDAVALVKSGKHILVDGTTGEVVVGPTADQSATAATEIAPAPPLSEPGQLADGTRIPLLANVGSPATAWAAEGAGAEGVGLLRTEMCFLERFEEPSIGEQRDMYAEVLQAFPGRPVVIRTLDAGSDKPIPFMAMPDEENPALGLRGYRTALARPEVLHRQLQAIAEAVQHTEADAWVMAPMISTPEEGSAFAEMVHAAGLPRAGVMIETPSAAVMAKEMLDAVDFVSVGTNDLAQYTMAADRLANQLSDLQDVWQPAVLRLIHYIGDAGKASGKPIGVCGEAAADPYLAPILVGLGARSLSMSSRALSAVAEKLAAVDLAACEAAAQAVCDASGPEEARRIARERLGTGRV